MIGGDRRLSADTDIHARRSTSRAVPHRAVRPGKEIPRDRKFQYSNQEGRDSSTGTEPDL